MDIRESILEGSVNLPNLGLFIHHFGTTEAETTARMFKSAWNSYLRNKGSINLTYWARQFESPLTFNSVLKILSDNKWLVSEAIPARRWAEACISEDKLLTYVSCDELSTVRATKKFLQYMPTNTSSKHNNLTRINNSFKYTGLERNGFKASSASEFSYDTDMLTKYIEPIIVNVNKGMSKQRNRFPEMGSDKASYDVVATAVVKALADSDAKYTLGSNVSDSRGRAIKNGLSKVANPVGYKDFRALLIIPEDKRNKATAKGVTAISLFIAELVGFDGTSILDKELFGISCYHNRTFHDLDLNTNEGRKELHENIWLERLYDDLDSYYSEEDYYWTVPVEVDARASILAYIGLLLGDKRLLEMTNVMFDGELTDPWEVEGVPRHLVKQAATRQLYGSTQPTSTIWEEAKAKDKSFAHTEEQVVAYDKVLLSGGLGVANDFKEFILRWVKPQATLDVKVYEDEFTIECNKFRNVGDTTIKYDIYDSIDERVKRVIHTEVKREPDLDRFKRFFVTLCIHGIDSQVLDFLMERVMSSYGWAIDIHDAVICCPEAADDVRTWYAEELDIVYDNRKAILTNFFNSIGIRAEAQQDWENLMNKVQPAGRFKASKECMK